MRWVKQTCITALALLALLLPASSGQAQQQQHAGLVLQFADGHVQTYCIAFSEQSISGLDLLLKTGLPVQVQSYGGTNVEVCKIGDDGCNYPEQLCACQSYGPGGKYWSYHHLKGGKWQISGVGAGSYSVHDGDVDGWAWSDGSPPALTSFAQVCAAALPSTPTPTAIERLPTATLRPRPTSTLVKPTTTRRGATPIRQTAPPTAQPIGLTDTPAPTTRPSDTPTAELTATLMPTPESSATPTAMPLPTIILTPTPITKHPSPDEVARNVGLAIGAAVLGGLAIWSLLGLIRKRGSRVE
jgi:hypothetical protein